jgi:uncharacterized protein (DUF2252 family)
VSAPAPPTTPAERAARLSALRDAKMSATVHAFVRASAPLFYEVIGGVTIPVGPAIWICGDSHGENVGTVPDAKGAVVFGMNDFDEAVVGNPAHDVARMALSLTVAMRGAGHDGATIVGALSALVDGYDAGIEGKRDVDPEAARFRETIADAKKMDRRDFIEHLCGDAHAKKLPLGDRFWPISDALRDEVQKLVASSEVLDVVKMSGDVDPDDAIELVDAAFRVAGTASLGGLRIAALIEIDGKSCSKRDRLRVLDIKEVQPGCAPRLGKTTPHEDAARVMAGTIALSPAYGARKRSVVLHGKPALVRELMPQERKASVDALERDEVVPVARSLGRVIGRAHGRQLDARHVDEWRRTIDAHRDKGAPPAWLVDAIVALVGAHEGHYLRHCVHALASGADGK